MIKISSQQKIVKNRIPALILITVGLISPIGYFFNITALKGLGLSYAISPLPLVFSDVNGFETFSAKFELNLNYVDGESEKFEISPRSIKNFSGPYNRRNVYGAAISYSPRLPSPVVQSILFSALCEPGFIKEEFAIKKDIRNIELITKSQTQGRENQSFQSRIKCKE